MGTRGFELVRFRGRYYIRYQRLDSYYEGLGARIISSIPADPEKYKRWLKSMRTHYANEELYLEQHFYEIDADPERGKDFFDDYTLPPTALPRLGGYGAEHVYIINLDQEVLTMDYCIHWKLGNIPRQDGLWLRAIKYSIYGYKPTVSLELCPEEHLASPALELPKPDPDIQFKSCSVEPKADMGVPWKVFLVHNLARVLVEYVNEIVNFGREWSPDSFPFREFCFALISIASGEASFHSDDWDGGMAPFLEFGSMRHRRGDPPGASPPETIFWYKNVLVSLTLVVDGAAISKAVAWGIEQGRTNFEVIVMSLFEVAFAEVTFVDDEPFVKANSGIYLSPLREKYCSSSHPRERPEQKPGMESQDHRGASIMASMSRSTWGRRMLERYFPGLAALVNFFDVTANRHLIFNTGRLPAELYDRIMDFVDYETWKTCSVSSQNLRALCLRKYRLDDRIRIIGGPFTTVITYAKYTKSAVSFDFENMQIGESLPMVEVPKRNRHFKYTYDRRPIHWRPVIGSGRKVILSDVVVRFELDVSGPVA